MASTIPSGSWPYRKVQRPSANLFAMLGARIAKGETTDDVFGFLTAGVNAEVKASRPKGHVGHPGCRGGARKPMARQSVAWAARVNFPAVARFQPQQGANITMKSA